MASGTKKRYEGVERRVRLVGMGVLFSLVILMLRLWQLQIVHWFDYRDMAENNRLHPQRLKAPRGMIYGPDPSVVLADNRPSCDLVIVPAECRDAEAEQICSRLQELLGIDGKVLLEKIRKTKKQNYRQLLIKQDVTKNELTRVEEFSYALPGVFTVARPQRRYLYGKTAGQILGYMGEIGPDEFENMSDRYEWGDQIGRSGLEQMYEPQMRGRDGRLVVNVYVSDRRPQLRTDAYGKPYVEVDSYGRTLKEERSKREEPEAGEPIFTTLDIGLQQHCEEMLKNEVGGIAVLNADTGAVLAMASTPGFDPSAFVTHGRDRERIEALTAKPNPVRNRCYQEAYAPGSVFKVLLATAALEEGIIKEDTHFSCGGSFQLGGGGWTWHCWQRHGHGTVGVVDALAFSCDVFFYNVGQRLGVDQISAWSKKLGLGQLTGIDLPKEVKGLIPDKEWRENLLRPKFPKEPWKWRWYPGYTINLAIGQGEATTTPLQNAVLMSAIVNGGYRVTPHVNLNAKVPRSEKLISDKTLAIVQAGLRKCVEKDKPPSGTGKAARVPGMAVLGKTGTAQMVSLAHHEQYKHEGDIPYNLRDHAWFVAGTLDQDPKIAMCILIEHGAHGSSAAAPLAKEVIEYFYAHHKPPELAVASQDSGS